MIELINLKPGDTIKTQIAYIFGKCFDKIDYIKVINSSYNDNEINDWQVKNCFFKVNLIVSICCNKPI